MARKIFSDAELLDLLRDGDHAAFHEIYKRYFGLLFVHAVKRLGNEEEASDLLQELFANLWDKREKLSITGELKGYLYTAVRNRVLNLIAQQKTSTKYLEHLANFSYAAQPQADHQLREKDLAALIEKEVNALPPHMRRIFYMSRRDEMTYQEIAVELDTTEEAVKSQMKRALRTLRYRLGLYTFLLFLIKF